MLKILSGLPLLGVSGMGTLKKADNKTTEGTNSGPENNFYKRNFFEEVGVEPLINAAGTYTTLSGSLMLPETVGALHYTSKRYARLNEVQDKVGERIAEMLNCEAAMVTAGAASALTLGPVAVITLGDKEKITDIPICADPRPEIIIQKSHRFGYDFCTTLSGAQLIEVEGGDQMEKAINENTIMALYLNKAANKPNSISREEFVSIGKRNNVITFNDAAADVPPKDSLYEYTDMGFDLVTFSGGKMLRGPQSAGLLLGRKDLIEAAKLNFVPNIGIGRGMKVNKEEMFGMYAAVKSYVERDHEKEWQKWINWTKRIGSEAEKVPGVQAETIIDPGIANHFPGVDVRWDPSRVEHTPQDIQEALKTGPPSIEVRVEQRDGEDVLHLAVVTLRPDHVDVVARRLREELERVDS